VRKRRHGKYSIVCTTNAPDEIAETNAGTQSNATTENILDARTKTKKPKKPFFVFSKSLLVAKVIRKQKMNGLI
jgi:hypothetical protein